MRWRRRSIDFLSGVALYPTFSCAWNYFRLDAFSFVPDLYLASRDSLPHHTRYGLALASHPVLQLLIGLYCLVIALAFVANSRLYWPFVALLWITRWPLAPFDWSLFYFSVAAAGIAVIAYCWGERPRSDARQVQPPASSPAFLVAILAILLPIGLMAYVFVYKPRRAIAQTDLSALYGHRMVNRCGVWRVESLSRDGQSQAGLINSISFLSSGRCESRDASHTQSGSYFSYTQDIHITCLPKSISPSGTDFNPQWKGPHLILQSKRLQLTLTPDNWGPGYYMDLLPTYFTK